MKSILLLFILVMNCCIPFTQKKSQYELDFIKNEENIIKNNELIPKQEAANIVLSQIPKYYPKINKTELKQILENNPVIILAEEITPDELRGASDIQYFYIVIISLADGRILTCDAINAKTGKSWDGMNMDTTNKDRYIALLTREEIIAYLRKHFSFMENEKITIEAIYDYSFYSNLSLPSLATGWKYRITIQNGMFTSAIYPDGITTLFISPYVDSQNGKREEPTRENILGTVEHRIFVKRTKIPAQKAVTAAESSTATADVNETGPYYGVD